MFYVYWDGHLAEISMEAADPVSTATTGYEHWNIIFNSRFKVAWQIALVNGVGEFTSKRWSGQSNWRDDRACATGLIAAVQLLCAALQWNMQDFQVPRCTQTCLESEMIFRYIISSYFVICVAWYVCNRIDSDVSAVSVSIHPNPSWNCFHLQCSHNVFRCIHHNYMPILQIWWGFVDVMSPISTSLAGPWKITELPWRFVPVTAVCHEYTVSMVSVVSMSIQQFHCEWYWNEIEAILNYLTNGWQNERRERDDEQILGIVMLWYSLCARH